MIQSLIKMEAISVRGADRAVTVEAVNPALDQLTRFVTVAPRGEAGRAMIQKFAQELSEALKTEDKSARVLDIVSAKLQAAVTISTSKLSDTQNAALIKATADSKGQS